MTRLKVGCCGFAGSRASYFQQFPVVEVQQTFYKLPRLGTARRWRQEAPPDFEFTLKAWQVITHHASSPTYRKAGISVPPQSQAHYGFFRPTREVQQAWEATLEVAEALEAHTILFQCPARFTPTEENVENLRRFVRQAARPGLTLVWEPRGDAWTPDLVAKLCRELGLVHAVDPFQAERATTGPCYLRLHGGPGYRHQYTDEELRWLAERWGSSAGYILFNNLSMRADAARLMRLLRD